MGVASFSFDPCCRLLTISKLTFSKNSLMNTIRVSNSLDLDQDPCSFSPDLGPNCLQRLSADSKKKLSRARKEFKFCNLVALFILKLTEAYFVN